MQSTASLLPGFRCISFDQRGVGESLCHDGLYDLYAYIDDVEAIRSHLGIKCWHVLGHSWGGVVAQAYTSACPERVKSLELVSSSLGVGADWKRTKREAFRADRARAGMAGVLRILGYGSGLTVPGPIGAWSMRHVMTETWHDYFLDPASAPDPDPTWLNGCSAKAMVRTDRAVSKQLPGVLNGLSSYEGPVLVLYGAYDIFGDATAIVRGRFPQAVQVTLEGSGHLHWLQNPSAYAKALDDFFGHATP
jgi:pimeloyl-ACP methyl ester carboxylesterase